MQVAEAVGAPLPPCNTPQPLPRWREALTHPWIFFPSLGKDTGGTVLFTITGP